MAEIVGGQKFERELARIAAALGKGPTLKVGFLGNATYPDGTPVAFVAATLDFGAPRANIPPRPFFRNLIKQRKGEWPKNLASLLKANGYNAKKALRLLGTLIRDQLQQSIRDTNSPPLKPSTLKKRGVDPKMKYNPKDPKTFGAKPLIATGYMISKADFEIEE